LRFFGFSQYIPGSGAKLRGIPVPDAGKSVLRDDGSEETILSPRLTSLMMAFVRTKTLSPCFIRINEVFYFFNGASSTYAIDEYSYRFYIAHCIVKRISTMSKG
jgi:hypothetical protein